MTHRIILVGPWLDIVRVIYTIYFFGQFLDVRCTLSELINSILLWCFGYLLKSKNMSVSIILALNSPSHLTILTLEVEVKIRKHRYNTINNTGRTAWTRSNIESSMIVQCHYFLGTQDTVPSHSVNNCFLAFRR